VKTQVWEEEESKYACVQAISLQICEKVIRKSQKMGASAHICAVGLCFRGCYP